MSADLLQFARLSLCSRRHNGNSYFSELHSSRGTKSTQASLNTLESDPLYEVCPHPVIEHRAPCL